MGRVAYLVSSAALICAAAAALALAADRTGTGRADVLIGTRGDDVLKGLGGADVLRAGGGRDVLIGGRGADALHGEGGRDAFNMRDGAELRARGRDRIYARDGRPDEINCGEGGDLAVVDEVEDGIFDCEVVREP